MYKNLKRKIALFIIFIVVAILSFNLDIYKVSGESMAPTLQNSDYVLVCKTCGYSTGDLVIFRNPRKEVAIKRIIGMDGDYIKSKNGSIYRNGVNLDIFNDSMVKSYSLNNQLFVVGDNYRNSYDSREFGTIMEEDVLGKVIFHT